MSGGLAGVLWMDQVVADGDDLAPRPPLDGDTEVDVAVVGAGFTGLWTAFHLLRGDPVIQLAPPLIAGPAEFAEMEQILRGVLGEAWARL